MALAAQELKEWEETINRAFAPMLKSIGGSYTDSELTRIADACEYSAAQLFEIRRLLQQMMASTQDVGTDHHTAHQ